MALNGDWVNPEDHLTLSHKRFFNEKFGSYVNSFRFVQQRDKISRNFEKFFERIGSSYGNFKGKSKNSALSSEILANISAEFPEISLDWLLNGQGDIEKKAQSADISTSDEVNGVIDSLHKIIAEKDKMIQAQREIIGDLRSLVEHYRSISERGSKKAG